jgi:hypothetical protein
MSIKKSNRRVLVFECLEERSLLAGNLNATVLDGLLTVSGNKKDNCVEVKGSGGGNVLVTETCKGTINGLAEPFEAIGPITAVTVSTKAGNDTILIKKLNLDTLRVFGGAGLDKVSVDTTTVNILTSMKMHEDDDTVDFYKSDLSAGRFSLDGGDGIDTVKKKQSTFNDAGLKNIP